MTDATDSVAIAAAAAYAQLDQLSTSLAHGLQVTSRALDPAFPVAVFPAYARDYITETQRVNGLPLDFLCVSVLATAAGLLGNRVELLIKTTHRERPILWLVMIGTPGSGKSGAIDLARPPLDALQARYLEQYRQAMDQHDGLPKEERSRTPLPRSASSYTTDTTVEALCDMLQRSHGLVVLADELASWLAMDRYRSGKGGDRPMWLSMWSGAPVKVDRKSSATIMVERPAVSIIGGIQPDLLPTLRAEQGHDDGFLDRILPVWWIGPPPGNDDDGDVDQTVIDHYRDRMLRLATVGPVGDGPIGVTFSADARALWKQFNQDNRFRNADGFSAKSPRHVARLALTLHGMNGRANDPLSEATLSDAITVFEYFRHQHNRMMRDVGAGGFGLPTDPEARLRQRIERTLSAAGPDGLSRTELHRRLGNSAKADEIEFVLDALRRDGTAAMTTIPTGKRPREVWRLIVAGERPAEDMNYEDMAGSSVDNFITSYVRPDAEPDAEGETMPADVPPRRSSARRETCITCGEPLPPDRMARCQSCTDRRQSELRKMA